MTTIMQEKFIPSINIKLDFGKLACVKRYLPTPSHGLVFEKVLKGFLDDDRHAHLVVGPYGTGKSLLGTILSNIAAKKIDDEWLYDIGRKYQTVNDRISDLLVAYKEKDLRILPVFLSGNEGNLQKAIQRALEDTLKNNSIAIPLSSDSRAIEQIIGKWKSEYEDTFQLFELKVLENYRTYEDFWLSVCSNDLDAIEWFKNYYREVTSGAEFPVVDMKLYDFFEPLLQHLQSNKLGIFIVYDEFGRFMQSLSMKTVYKEMELLQDLAELSERVDNLHLMFISHQNMHHYTSGMEEDIQKEFRRIEKRFSNSWIESDRSTIVRLAHLSTEDYRLPLPTLNYEEIKKQILLTGLFSTLTAQEQDELIVRGSYPLHPTTLYTLPFIADKVAQNERTLFTFLQSNEPLSLPYLYYQDPQWITLDHLFDYFETSIKESDRSNEINQVYRLYNSILQRLTGHENYIELVRILKVITISHMSGINQHVMINDEFLSFSLPDLGMFVPKMINTLKQLKVILFRKTSGHIELFKGSDINFDLLLEDKRRKTNLNRRQRMNVLSRFLPNKYYLARRYNDEKCMIRYAYIEPVMAAEILDNNITDFTGFLDNSGADLLLVYVMGENRTEIDDAVKEIESISYDPRIMFAVLEEPVIELTDTIYDLVNLERLEKDRSFVQQDIYIQEEIDAMKQEVIQILEQKMTPFFQFSEDVNWIRNTERHSVKSEYHLGRYLSDILFEVFPLTPVVKNEAFNRQRTTSNQKRASCIVIDKVLKNTNEARLGLEGWGPEYLIYATVLKNNKIHDGTSFQTKDQYDSCVQSLASYLDDFLLNNPKGSFHSLINLFRNPPFGIRKPLIPLWLSLLLKDQWRFIAIRKQQTLLTDLSGSLLYEIVDQPELFTYEYQVVAEDDLENVSKVKSVFSQYLLPEERVLDTPLVMSKLLTRWFHSLPRFTQQTRQMPKEVKNLFRFIRVGIQDPFKLTQGISGYSVIDLEQAKQKAEDYLSKYKFILSQKILDQLGFDSFSKMKEWAKDQHDSRPYVQSKLITVLMKELDEGNWIEAMINQFVGVPLSDWSDQTEDTFIEQIHLDFKEITSGQEVNADEVDTLEINGRQKLYVSNLPLKGKSTLIYENIRRTIKTTGRTLDKREIQAIYWKLLMEALNEA